MATGYFFDQFVIGSVFRAGPRLLTANAIDDFAALTGDVNRLHLDDEFAKSKGFKRGRIAHGALVLSLALGMAWQSGFLEDTTQAFREVGSFKFNAPAYPGDTLFLIIAVEGLKAYPKLQSGMVTFRADVVNQDKDIICGGTLHLLMAMRPAA